MLYRVLVIGQLHGQWCNNSIDYWAPDLTSLVDVLEGFRTQWRNQVIAKVSSQYSALQYEVKRLGGAVLRDMPGPVQLSKLIWVQRLVLPGLDAADTGGQDVQAFPSHDALGIVKVASEWLDPSGVAVTDIVKPPKGGALGIGGIPESVTDKAVNGNNQLIPADQLAWQNVANALRTFAIAGPVTIRMAVITHVRNNVALMVGTPSVPSFNYAFVNQVIVNPFVTTRVSRKQRRNVLS